MLTIRFFWFCFLFFGLIWLFRMWGFFFFNFLLSCLFVYLCFCCLHAMVNFALVYLGSFLLSKQNPCFLIHWIWCYMCFSLFCVLILDVSGTLYLIVWPLYVISCLWQNWEKFFCNIMWSCWFFFFFLGKKQKRNSVKWLISFFILVNFLHFLSKT